MRSLKILPVLPNGAPHSSLTVSRPDFEIGRSGAEAHLTKKRLEEFDLFSDERDECRSVLQKNVGTKDWGPR